MRYEAEETSEQANARQRRRAMTWSATIRYPARDSLTSRVVDADESPKRRAATAAVAVDDNDVMDYDVDKPLVRPASA